MPSDLIAYKEWLKRTDSLGHARSGPLKELDAELERYERFGGGDAKARVGQKLEAWKRSQGLGEEWKKSRRNRDLAMEQLTAMLGGADSDKAWGRVPDFMHSELIHARLGVVYLFGHMRVDTSIFTVVLEGGLSMANSMLNYAGIDVADGGLGHAASRDAALSLTPCMVAGNEIIAAGLAATPTPHPRTRPDPGAFQVLVQRVRTWMESFVNDLLRSLKEKFMSFELPAAAIKAVINAAVSATCSVMAAGIVAGSMDLVKGVVNTLAAAMQKYETWRLGKGVELAPGHPSTVVESIRRAMTMSLFAGLWQTMKGAGNLGLVAASAGAGMIANVLVAAGEMVIKVIWRLVEVTHMSRFMGEAAEHWRNRDAAGALHQRPFAFASWYRKFALNAPALSVITLNSGICGDKMNYLSLFKEDRTQISTDEFRTGAQFIDSLKPWGTDYLKSCGYAFRGTDSMVSALLQLKHRPADAGNPAWNFIKTVATA